MRKTVIRTIYLVVVFIVSCLLISKVMSQGNTDITMEMAEPTYPIVSFRIGNESVNQWTVVIYETLFYRFHRIELHITESNVMEVTWIPCSLR